MPTRLTALLPTLQVMRIALVFTAISNSWLIVLLGRARESTPGMSAALREMPLWVLLLCTAAVASGLYTFGMVLNDVMDVRRDKVFAPSRPLPSGRMSIAAAVSLAFICLMLAVAASLPLGTISVILTLVTAALILFYDSLGKHLPAVGILSLGLIRAGNMLVANPSIGFAWPVWWTFTHIVILSAVCHHLERKRPLFSAADLWITIAGWAFASVGIIGWMSHKDELVLHTAEWIWLGPIAAATVFLLIAMHTFRTAKDSHQAGGLLMKRGLLHLIVYDAAWLLGAGLWIEGGVLLMLMLLAYGAMVVMRNLAAALAEPPRYIRDGRRTV